MHKSYYFPMLLGLIFINITSILAQENSNHSKKSYVDSLNRYYIQAEMPLYVYVSTSPNEKPTQLPTSNRGESSQFKPIYLDGHGKHYLKHTDALHRTEDRFAVYADGIAPVSKSKFSGAPKYLANNQLYYGKGLSVSLSTKDEMSGIQNLYYTLDQDNYLAYENELSLAKEGSYIFAHYAVDNVGNVEKTKKTSFIVDVTAPNTFHNIVGIAQNKIISTSTKIYLSIQDTLSGVSQTYYYFDNEKERLFIPNSTIPFNYLADGEHTLYYYSIDHVDNKEELKSFTFYLDKSSPIMSADVLGDRFIVDDKVYFSGRTKLKLTAVDNKSGIKQVLYSIDGQEYQEYGDPFYLPRKAGLHTIRYYAVDNIGNQGVSGKADKKFDEYKHNAGQVYVDLTGPILSHKFQGATFQKGDTLYLNNRTQIRLNAYDPESGLQRITYSIDKQGDELLYEQPFQLSTDGLHTIDYHGYDNVNNRNIKDFLIVLDSQGPEILYNFSNPATQDSTTYPSYVTLFLAARDANTTIQAIYYSINGQAEVPYSKPIGAFLKNNQYSIQIRAVDTLGNETKSTISFRTDSY